PNDLFVFSHDAGTSGIIQPPGSLTTFNLATKTFKGIQWMGLMVNFQWKYQGEVSVEFSGKKIRILQLFQSLFVCLEYIFIFYFFFGLRSFGFWFFYTFHSRDLLTSPANIDISTYQYL